MATLSKFKKIMLCLVFPILVQALGAILIIQPESGASGGPFAGLLVLVMFLIAAPITLIANAQLLASDNQNTNFYLKRGMIAPGVFLFCCVFYYSGLWDDYIDPLLPSSMPLVSPASSTRVGPNATDEFFTLSDYTGSQEDLSEISEWVVYQTLLNGFEEQWHHRWFFVPRESYDPIDNEISRQNAVVIFENDPSNEQLQLLRTLPSN